MHRSGTSLVAQVMSRLDVCLGPEDRLMPPEPENPDGFFENCCIVALNDKLLDLARGSWDVVPGELAPALRSRWQRDYGGRASRICADIARHTGADRTWGWKDPRASVTLPFWITLFPDAHVVVCVRDPLCVARSLRRRNYVSLRFGLKLCEDYLLHLDRNIASARDRTLMVSLERLRADPVHEVGRMARFIDAPAGMVEAASGAVKPALIHHEADIRQAPKWCRDFPKLLDVYAQLLASASDVAYAA